MFDNLRGKIADILSPRRNGAYYQGSIIQGSPEPYTIEKGLRDSTVKACIHTLANTVAQLEPIVVDADNKRVEDHPLVRQVKNANLYSKSSNHFLYSIMRNKLSYGNAYVEILRDNSGSRTGFSVLHSPDMAVLLNEFGVPTYTYKMAQILFDDIMHLVDIPTDNIVGPSRVKEYGDVIARKLRADMMIERIFDTGLKSVNIVSIPTGVPMDEIEAAKVNIQTHIDDTSHRQVVLLPGGATLTNSGEVTPADPNTRAYTESQTHVIAAVFNVPPIYVGAVTSDKYNNARERRRAFFQDSVYPHVAVFESEFTNMLDDGLFFKLDATDFLKGDIQQQTQDVAIQVKEGIITQNEARKRLDIPPHTETEGASDSDKLPPIVKPAATANRRDDIQGTTGGNDGPDGSDNANAV